MILRMPSSAVITIFSVGDGSQNLNSMLVHCLLPSLLSVAVEFLVPLLMANVLLRLLLAFVSDGLVAHLATVAIGMASVAWQLREESFLAFLVASFALTSSVVASRCRRMPVIWLLCLLVLLSNEAVVFLASPSLHHSRIRTHLMLITMKQVSWVQLKSEESDSPMDTSFWSCLAYVCHPMSCVLGSWHPASSVRKRGRYIKAFVFLNYALICLVASNCLVQFLATQFMEPVVFHLFDFLPEEAVDMLHKLCISYFLALQFRTSHYFICCLTEACFAFWGSEARVVLPRNIEFPRSLVDVVVCWNIPFHLWVRKHVFKPLKARCGTAWAVLLTYCVSSMLHGFNFQIWSVLLSLGCLTLLEFHLRHKLSLIYSACMQSKACPMDCGHQQRNPVSANLLFSLLAMLHLAFLGSAFDGSEDSSSMVAVLTVWQSLGFYSPIIGIMSLALYLLL